MLRTCLAVCFGLVLQFVVVFRVSADFIVNGNFEQGYTAFSTQYEISPTTVVGGAGQYLIVNNPAFHHPSGASYGDHTTGSGLMMMVNESRTPNRLVWGQSVSLSANMTYHFSAFISSWTPSSPSRLDVLFNGISIGTMSAPGTTGQWVEFSADWNSGAATTLTIELRNLTTADVGGDFALDDISLTSQIQPVPAPSGFLLGASGAVCVFFRRFRSEIRQV